MARGKWFLPYKKNRINYEDIGVLPYLVQHDIGFNGDKLFRVVKWNGPGSGTFSLVGETHSAGDTAGYGKRATASDTRKARARAVADARRLAGKQNPRLPAKWTPAQVRVNSKGQVQLKINPAKLGTGSRFAACVRDVKSKGSAYDPYAVCASAGRRKYGKRKMAKWAAKGLRRAIKRAGGHRPNRMRRRY